MCALRRLPTPAAAGDAGAGGSRRPRPSTAVVAIVVVVVVVVVVIAVVKTRAHTCSAFAHSLHLRSHIAAVLCADTLLLCSAFSCIVWW